MALTSNEWLERLRRVLGAGDAGARQGDAPASATTVLRYDTRIAYLSTLTTDIFQVIPRGTYDTIDCSWSVNVGGEQTPMLLIPGQLFGVEGVQNWTTLPVGGSIGTFLQRYPPAWVFAHYPAIAGTDRITFAGSLRLEIDQTNDSFCVLPRDVSGPGATAVSLRVTLRTLRH